MRPILFSLGSLNFYSYGFLAAIGFIVGGLVIDYLAKKKKLLTSKHREFFLIDALLLALASGLIGARLTYIVLYNFIFQVEPLSQVGNLLTGGFVYYGGILTGFLALYWWFHRYEMQNIRWYDVIIVGLMVSYTFSEIGGYLNDGLVIRLAGFVGGIVLTGFAYLTFLAEKKPGRAVFSTLLVFFIFKFFLGFWAAEPVVWIGLGLGQWASLAGALIVGYLFSRQFK